MVMIILLGRVEKNHVDMGNSFFWEILYQSLATLVAQGEIEEEKIDIQFYAPSKQEIEDEIRKEGSFKVEQIEMFETDKDPGNCSSYGVEVAMTVRSIRETMLSHHFGDKILDKLFDQYAKLVYQELAKQDINSITIVLALTELS